MVDCVDMVILRQNKEIMKRAKKLPILLLVLLFVAQASFGQCPSNAYQTLDINRVSAQFNNSAEIFWDLEGLAKYEVPKGMGANTVFAGSFWIGGLDPQGNLHASSSNYRQNQGTAYLAGPYKRPSQMGCNFEIETPDDIHLKGLKRLASGKVLILHGTGLLIYDPISAQTISRTFATPRQKLDAVELTDGRVLIWGDHAYPNKNPIMILDTTNFSLTNGTTLTWFHQESRGIQLNSGNVLFAGVVGCELYDPIADSAWAVPDMLWPRMHFGMAKMPNGDVMAFGGGSTLSGTGNSPLGQRFDDSLGYWFPGQTMSIGRNRPEMTELNDGTFLISGRDGTGTTVTEIYHPQSDSLSIGPSLPFVVNEHSILMQASGNLFIARGTQFTDGPSLFEFDPMSGAWSPGNIQRTGTNIVSLSGDDIFVTVEDNRHLERLNSKTSVQKSSRWQYVWKVSRAEINQFQSDYAAGTVNFENYPSIELWPAHGDESGGEDRNLAPFIDVNMDGYYKPLEDGDYPCIVGDQALWYVYNDQGDHSILQTPGMGIQVEVMAYAFDCGQTPCPDMSTDFATFMHYEITNQSDTAWSNVYFGNFMDVDLGDWQDDFIGCDTTRDLGFVYNGDDNDNNIGGSGGYGLHPPAWGVAVLPNNQVDRMAGFMTYDNNFDSVVGNPTTGDQFYNLLQSKWLNGDHLVANGSDGNPNSSPGQPTNFMFPSTEGFCGGFLSGWSEITAARTPFDRRLIQSYGPYNLAAGEKIQLDIVMPFARGFSNIESVCLLKDATTKQRDFWQNQIDKSCFNIVVGIDEAKAEGKSLKLWPNPNNGQFNFSIEEPIVFEGEIKVYSLAGAEVYSQKLVQGQSVWEMNCSDWPKGMYIIQLEHDQILEMQRLVLQ